MDVLSTDETISEIDRRLIAGQFTQHVVVNVAKLVQMQDDPGLRAAVAGCDIINIDGAGVVFAARLLGIAVPERVTGIDLFHRLLGYAESTGRSVYLLGAESLILDQAVANIRKDHPLLRIAGFHHGFFAGREDQIVEAIRTSGAELLFVGISSPLKEQFVNRWKDTLGVKLAMGVGGTFDVVAGKVKRAPLWMQRAGLEWLFRVMQEPRRLWRRYLITNARFLGMVLKELRLGSTRQSHRPDH